MFFEDQREAIHEMARVLRPGGWLAVAVWDALENTPGYFAMVELLQRLFGNQAADALRYPYNLGDKQVLRTLFASAGLPHVEITTLDGIAQFPSIEAWVYTDVKGWTLADMMDDEQYAHLLDEAERDLQPFVTAYGVLFRAPAHIVSAVKR
jgi:hypothetical protein